MGMGMEALCQCHVLAGGRSLWGDRPNVGPGYSGSGTNHCLLVSFPLLGELLSRTAPTGEEGRGMGRGHCGVCVCVYV